MGLREARRRRARSSARPGGWPQQPSKYEIDTVSYVNTLLHTFNQTHVRGVHGRRELGAPVHERARPGGDATPTTARTVLPGFQQFFPAANPDNLLPQASFSGGTARHRSRRSASSSRWPFFGYNTLFNFSGNLTKVQGRAQHEDGIFVEHTTRPAQRSSTFNGTLSFNTDGSNPLNTNLGFANALLGAVTQYQESNGHPSAHGQFMNTEFYVQDNWRVTRNFTDRRRRPVLLHHADPEPGRQGRRSSSPDSWSAGAGAAALPAGDRQRRARRASTR